MAGFRLPTLSLVLVSVFLSPSVHASDCSTIPNSVSYVSSNTTCCQNFYFSILQPQCCTRSSTVCMCNPTFNYGATVCILTTTTTVIATTPAPTSAATTTVAATTTTTTPLPPPLCPTALQARLLDSVTLSRSACIGAGTVGFEVKETGESLCNGALVLNQGTKAYDIYTVQSCIDEVTTRFGNGKTVLFVVGDQRMSMDKCSMADFRFVGPLSAIVLSPLAEYLMRSETRGCADVGCAYNRTSMKTSIRWTDCYVTSFGATAIGSEVGGHLTTINVQPTDIIPCLPAPSGIQCFTPVVKGTACVDLGDDGAPLYCTLSTGEHVLYGLAYVNTCVAGSSFFSVYPLQAYGSF